jgi:hypothetical protein
VTKRSIGAPNPQRLFQLKTSGIRAQVVVYAQPEIVRVGPMHSRGVHAGQPPSTRSSYGLTDAGFGDCGQGGTGSWRGSPRWSTGRRSSGSGASSTRRRRGGLSLPEFLTSGTLPPAGAALRAGWRTGCGSVGAKTKRTQASGWNQWLSDSRILFMYPETCPTPRCPIVPQPGAGRPARPAEPDTDSHGRMDHTNHWLTATG